MAHKLSIIVPVYNEAQTIQQVLDRVDEIDLGGIEKEVIVVDDGSTDGSARIIEERMGRAGTNRLAHLSIINLGKGAAIRFGFKHATGDILMIQDADLELDPAECTRLIAPILAGEASVVYGSRFKQPSPGISARTRWANRLLTWLTNILFGARLTDMETAYKVFRRDVLQAISLRCVGFDIEPEITARVLQAGFRIRELPVAYNPRRKDEGKKISWTDGIDAIYTLLRCRLIAQRGRPAARRASLMSPPDRSAGRWATGLLATLLVALALRAVFPLSDPPWLSTIGITWHDEGVWAHNARNKVLFGQWQLDQWNPMYVSPAFTGLEYLSFSAFGVGLWQARLVSIVAGLAATFALAVGLRAIATPGVALTGALLLAVNFTWVMYSRVALLEATMVAALVGSWACYARAERNWRWGAGAALLGLLAFFTKASAAFFLIALGLDACWVGWRAWRSGNSGAVTSSAGGAIATFAVLGVGTLVALAVFVVPHWADYSFYNLFVYGSRRSSMSLGALLDRASWFPVVHGFFARQWLLSVASLCGLVTILVGYRRATFGERMLVLWFLLGAFELVLHDLGNERRYVFLIPPMVCLAALLLLRDRRLLPEAVGTWSRAQAARTVPLLLAGLYVVFGSLTRQFFMPDIRTSVRIAGLAAVITAAVMTVMWPRLGPTLVRVGWSWRRGVAILAVIVAVDLALFGHWAFYRTSKNYDASIAVGRLLPPGTLVQGKLANGLALDNQIRPLFIGPGFGNYADRLARPDVAWILTYSQPRLGYEGVVVRELLEAMPGWKSVAEFPVAETRSGDDRAILIRKPLH